MTWLDSITDSMDTKSEQTPGESGGQGAGRAAVRGVAEMNMT